MTSTEPQPVEIPKKVAAYRVISSTSDEFGAVGSVLIDRVARGKVYTWHWYEADGSPAATVTGRRVARCCPACYAVHRTARNLGHDGDHGAIADLVLSDRDERPAPNTTDEPAGVTR